MFKKNIQTLQSDTNEIVKSQSRTLFKISHKKFTSFTCYHNSQTYNIIVNSLAKQGIPLQECHSFRNVSCFQQLINETCRKMEEELKNALEND